MSCQALIYNILRVSHGLGVICVPMFDSNVLVYKKSKEIKANTPTTE